jgi:hypothetical protein
MRLLAITAALLPALVLATPALAATKAQKMETCKFGADSEKPDGAKREAFIKKCMGSANYEPEARKEALKKAAAEKKMKNKKTTAKPAAAAPAATNTAAKPQ